MFFGRTFIKMQFWVFSILNVVDWSTYCCLVHQTCLRSSRAARTQKLFVERMNCPQQTSEILTTVPDQFWRRDLTCTSTDLNQQPIKEYIYDNLKNDIFKSFTWNICLDSPILTCSQLLLRRSMKNLFVNDDAWLDLPRNDVLWQ